MFNFGLDFHEVHPTTLAHVAKHLAEFENALKSLESIHGYVLLATCARVEFYVEAAKFDAVQLVLEETLTHVFAAAGAEGDAQFVVRRDAVAIEHLFRVTSGLESQVVGETEILGQVRSGLVAARATGCLSRSLELAFNRAIHVSRKVRATYAPGQRSLIHSALTQLNLADAKSAILIGTGQYARVCAQTLRAHGVTTITAYSPSGRTDDVLDVDGYIGSGALASELATTDLVVTCSGQGARVVTADLLTSATVTSASTSTSVPLYASSEACASEDSANSTGSVLETRQHPLHIIDLAASSDVSPEVDALSGIHVLRLADIASLDADLEVADDFIQDAVREVMPRIADTELDDLIVALRSRVTDIVQPQLRDEDSLTAHKVIQALLHTPTVRAREAAALGRLDDVRYAFLTLFGTESLIKAPTCDLTLTESDLRAFEELLAVS